MSATVNIEKVDGPDASSAVLPQIDYMAAARRLSTVAIRTPLVESKLLNERVSRRVLLKSENLQCTGSFKFRGAYNKLSKLKDEKNTDRVVAWSSGNHAIAVSKAASSLSMEALVVIPSDAPRCKIAAVEEAGGQIYFYKRGRENRETIARSLALKHGAEIIPSYDDADIIAGQATVALEISAQMIEAGAKLGDLAVPCGGGGLAAGCAQVLWDARMSSNLWCIEPLYYDDMRLSLLTGRRVAVEPKSLGICDGLGAETPGKLTFPFVKRVRARACVVDDDKVREAVEFALHKLRMVIEPSGAIGLAACLAGSLSNGSGDLCIILSGGNIDLPLPFSARDEKGTGGERNSFGLEKVTS